MSTSTLREVFGTNSMTEVHRKICGQYIKLERQSISIIVPLSEWNSEGLDLKINF